MRKLLTICALLLSPLSAWATFGAATAWDVRTTGVDTNGGAYDSGVGSPGTNESLGSSVAITITLTGTTTGTGSPAFSSTTHGPGNFVHIASGSGCTVGWYEILSQSAGTATFDHAMGTSTNVCVGVIGGSLLTPVTAMNLMASNNTVWVQSGTYTQTTNGLVNNALNPAIAYVTGYNTTHGDGGTAPLLTTATNSIDIIRLGLTGTSIWTFTNISLSNTAGTRANGIQDYTGNILTVSCIQCTLDGFFNAFNGDNAGAHGIFTALYLDRVEIKNGTDDGIVNAGGTNLAIVNCYIHNNGRGSNTSFATQFVIGSIFANNTTDGFKMSSGNNMQVINSVFTGSTSGGSGAGIRYDTGGNTILNLQNNILYGNVTGFSVNSGTPLVIANNNNAYGNNSFANRTGLAAGTNDVTLSAGPFTNSGAGDYSLNSTAGGGAAARGAGYPGIFPGATTTAHADIGAVQGASSGSSSGGNFGISY